jgi:adenosylmethionine-8-amino-7-oxononanoate aminotransferase
LKRRLVDAGVWVRPFGNVVYLTPALTIDGDDLAALIGAVVAVLRQQRP